MFEDAKVGDRVWSVGNGWGTIDKIDETMTYPIRVTFDEESSMDASTFTFKGQVYEDDRYPSLFWSEVKITPPPKPKRKVKKTIEGWGNVYPAGDGVVLSLHATQEKADKGADKARRLGPAMYFRHEYEVEE